MIQELRFLAASDVMGDLARNPAAISRWPTPVIGADAHTAHVTEHGAAPRPESCMICISATPLDVSTPGGGGVALSVVISQQLENIRQPSSAAATVHQRARTPASLDSALRSVVSAQNQPTSS
ncbi:hypothetical protein ACOMHN_050062 [Nucella lapillus]